MKFSTTLKILSLVLAAVSFPLAHASDYSPIASLGFQFHTGLPGSSIAGAKSYFLNLNNEKKKGFFRAKAIAELQYGKGDYVSSATKYSFSVTGADFQFGGNVFVFTEGQLQPYFGFSASLGARYMNLTVPTTSSLTAQSLGLAFGYEIAAGCDLRFGSMDGNSYRIEGAYSSKSSSLAGVSLKLDGFKLSFGKSF